MKQYVQELENRGIIDFNDILLKFISNESIKINKKVVIVDEFQDTSKLQYKALKKITANSIMVYAVGDDSQSIYAFNGANMKNMEEFVKDYNADVIFMEINYRSTATICKTANNLMYNSYEVAFRKTIVSNSGEEFPIHLKDGGIHDAAAMAEKLLS